MADQNQHQDSVHLEQETGILVSAYQGDQTAQIIQDVTEASKPLVARQRELGKPVFILIDTSQIGAQDSGARKAAIDGIETLDYDRLAIFGAPMLIKHVTQFLIQVSSKKDRVRYFDTEAQARNWLLTS